jgi:2-iminobutanoate/2-iminopropanoate deaminase
MPRVPARTDKAPKPAGPYSQAVRIDNIVAAAGQAGITPTGDVVEGVGAQTKQALANIAAALEAAGASMADVVSYRVFLTDTSQFEEMNAAYAEAVGEPYPARTTVYVGLPPGLLVEIDALAVVGERQRWAGKFRSPHRAGNQRRPTPPLLTVSGGEQTIQSRPTAFRAWVFVRHRWAAPRCRVCASVRSAGP